MSETYNCIPSLTNVFEEAWNKSTSWIHSGLSRRSRSENGSSSSSRKRRSSGGTSGGAAGNGSQHQTSHHDKSSAKSLRTLSSASRSRKGHVAQPNMTFVGNSSNSDMSSTVAGTRENRSARRPILNITSRHSSLRGPPRPVVAMRKATPSAKTTTTSASQPPGTGAGAGAGTGTGRRLQSVQSRDTIRLPVMHHNPALDFERIRATAGGQNRSRQSTPEQDEWARSYHQQWASGYRQQWSAGYTDPLRDGVYHSDQSYDSGRDPRYYHNQRGHAFGIPIGQAF